MRAFLLALLVIVTLGGCESEPKPGFGSWLGGKDDGFKAVEPRYTLQFPRDHNVHHEFRYEWWYFTANLVDENSQNLGVQWTQFRVALEPEGDELVGDWGTRQLYMAHSAVTTEVAHKADEKWSRAQGLLAGVQASPFRVFLDDWQWVSQTEDMFPATLEAQSADFSYKLKLTSVAPYQKQGVNGYSQKSADGSVASHYYSQPFIDVEGLVTIDGLAHNVTGRGWIDREWSPQFLLDSQQGWDWFALRLDDDISLVLFQLRDSQSGKANYSYGRLMHKNGSGQVIDVNSIQLSVDDTTRISGRDYPTQWSVSIPEHDVSLTVTALNPNSKMPLTVRYWEGPVSISGSHSGYGYMELTGY